MLEELGTKRLEQAIRRLKLMGMKDEGIVAVAELYSAMLQIGYQALVDSLVLNHEPITVLKTPSKVKTPDRIEPELEKIISRPEPEPPAPEPEPEPVVMEETIEIVKEDDRPVVWDGTKTCAKCGKRKPLSDFYADKKLKKSNSTGGVKNRCKQCIRDEVTERRNKKRLLQSVEPGLLEKLVERGLPIGKPKVINQAWTLHRITEESGLKSKEVKSMMNQLVRDGVAAREWAAAKSDYVYYLYHAPPLTLVEEPVIESQKTDKITLWT